MASETPATGSSGVSPEAERIAAALSTDDLVSQTLAADFNYTDPELVLRDMLETRQADPEAGYQPDPLSETYVAGLRQIACRAIRRFGITQEELFGEK